jgi:hypothetical protein|tara:strand:+ start:15156 stop:15314 length:159 start_codon:yes stop_codon:yes gene_type:complete
MEAEAMFPGVDVSDLLVVPTCQVRTTPTKTRQSDRGEAAGDARDRDDDENGA